MPRLITISESSLQEEVVQIHHVSNTDYMRNSSMWMLNPHFKWMEDHSMFFIPSVYKMAGITSSLIVQRDELRFRMILLQQYN